MTGATAGLRLAPEQGVPTRALGRSGIRASLIGAGCGSLAVSGGEGEAIAMLEAAWDAGLRYYDTAPLYGDSEKLLGKAFADKRRDDFVLASKVGRLPAPPGRRLFDYSRAAIERSIGRSLEHLQTDHLDVVAIHDATPAMLGERFEDLTRPLLDESLDYLSGLKQRGVIRALGLALYDADAAVQWLRAAPFDTVMIAAGYTLLNQAALAELLPLCTSRGIGVLVASPLHSGVLATGAVAGARFDYREASPSILDRVARIERLCKRYAVDLTAAALQFPLSHPVVASIIVGHRTPAEIHATLDRIRAPIPFWRALEEERLIPANFPSRQKADS